MTFPSKYKKVFSKCRFRTNAQNPFKADQRLKRVITGRRNELEGRTGYIGKIIESAKAGNLQDYDVFVDLSFPHVVGIFGSRGSGKSFDLGVLIESIFLADESSSSEVNDAAILFDIQDQFWTLGFAPSADIEQDEAHIKDIKNWGLSPEKIDEIRLWVPTSSDTQVPNAQQFALSSTQLNASDWLAILELERFSPMGQAMLRLLNVFGYQTPRELATHCIVSPTLQDYQQATIDGLRWRLQGLENSEIISESGLDIDELLRPGSLSIVLLRNVSEAIRSLIVGVIARLSVDRMGRIQQDRKVAIRTGKKPTEEGSLARRLWTVLDEAHLLIPSDRVTAATAPLIDYVKRGRDAGLSLVFATQQPSAVNSRLLSQVDMTITHMLGFDADLNAAVGRMPTRSAIEYEVDNWKVPSMSDVIRSLDPGEAVVADSASGRAFVAKIRPRVSAHGGATPK